MRKITSPRAKEGIVFKAQSFSFTEIDARAPDGKSRTGPNTGYVFGNTAALTTTGTADTNKVKVAAGKAANQYQFQLERASLVSSPVPQGPYDKLTAQVAQNNFYGTVLSDAEAQKVQFLRDHIKHVIYIVKENRTFDQILGDLKNGSNGDPSYTLFGESLTPNFHKMSRSFVTLDNFMDPGDGSMDGWSWALQARITQTETISQQLNYGEHGLTYESEGANRNVPVGVDGVAARDAATQGAFTATTTSVAGGPTNALVGPGNHASSDAPFGIQKGYVFSAVLNAGKTVRNYGFLVNNFNNNATTNITGTIANPVVDPFAGPSEPRPHRQLLYGPRRGQHPRDAAGR